MDKRDRVKPIKDQKAWTSGTVILLYEGLKTKTPYAIIHYDNTHETELHVVKQSEIEVIVNG